MSVYRDSESMINKLNELRLNAKLYLIAESQVNESGTLFFREVGIEDLSRGAVPENAGDNAITVLNSGQKYYIYMLVGGKCGPVLIRYVPSV